MVIIIISSSVPCPDNVVTPAAVLMQFCATTLHTQITYVKTCIDINSWWQCCVWEKERLRNAFFTETTILRILYSTPSYATPFTKHKMFEHTILERLTRSYNINWHCLIWTASHWIEAHISGLMHARLVFSAVILTDIFLTVVNNNKLSNFSPTFFLNRLACTPLRLLQKKIWSDIKVGLDCV